MNSQSVLVLCPFNVENLSIITICDINIIKIKCGE